MSTNTIATTPVIEQPYALPPGAGFGPADPHGQPHHHQQNLVKLVHRLLRGRYLIVILLCSIGAIAGAVGGYLSQTPKFKAEGLIRVQPVLPRILYDTEQTTMPPMFASFVNTQANLLQNDRVLSKAMTSDPWRSLARPTGPDADLDFRKSLKVVTSREAPELIFVSFTDEEARAALVAVQEIIRAYQDIFGGSETKAVREMQLTTLNQRRTELETRKRDAERQVLTASQEFETDDLTRLHDHEFTKLLALDTRVSEARLRFADLGVDPDEEIKRLTAGPRDQPEDAPGDSDKPAPPPTAEQIAITNPEMARLLTEQSRLKRNLARNRALGYGDQHPAIVGETGELAGIEAGIREIVDRYAAKPADAPAASMPVAGAPLRLDQLLDQYDRLVKQADALRAYTEKISRRQREIESTRREIRLYDAQLTEVAQRLDELNLEGKVADRIGRIEVILPEAAPSSPTVDPRRKMAAMGFVLGGGVPLTLMLLIGMIDRRFRYADQARDASMTAPMLGILPELPTGDSPTDPEQTAAAVHCVHHIRSLLQMGDAARKVYVITSPTAGDGKTSLALSLAMSFTASRSRTLVIDFDLIGCGLSKRLDAVRSEGLGQALIDGKGNGCVVPSGVPGLDLLPAGRDDARHLSRISRKAVSQIIDEYRDRYDSIIIDTGPVLGSLEANMAASLADGVILVVGRGQHGDRVQEALRHLGQLGATVVGMVFNRAHATDFARSSMSKSFRSLRTGEPRPTEPVTAVAPRSIAAADPLARSVVDDIRL